MGHDDDWPDIREELRRDLAEGLEVEGTVDEMDVLTHVGATSVEVVIQAPQLRVRSRHFDILNSGFWT